MAAAGARGSAGSSAPSTLLGRTHGPPGPVTRPSACASRPCHLAAEGGSGHPLSELSASGVDRDGEMQGRTDTEGDGERRGGERGGAGGREQEKVG